MGSVLVIGAGMGGLSAAIHARLAGHDVLVAEPRAVGGKAARIEQDGYVLDPGPSIVILPRLYEAVFKRANRQMADYLRFQRLDPISRVYFEGEEVLDLPASRDECVRIVRDRSAADGVAFEALLKTLDQVSPHIDRSVFSRPYDQPWQLADFHLIATASKFDVRSTYKALVDRMFQSPLLRSFFYGFPSYGGQTYDSKAPGSLMIPYLMIQEGVWYPEGGVSAIPAAFERLARELGVEFATHRVTSLETKGKKVVRALCEDGTALDAEAIISNVDRSTTRRWLGDSDDAVPSFSYFTLHWGIRQKLAGLAHHTLLVPKNFDEGFEALYRKREFPASPIVYLNATSLIDPMAAPEGCTNLFAVVTCPAEERHLDWEALAPLARTRVLASLERHGLGLDESLVDFERMQTPTYFRTAHGNHRGSLYGPDESLRMFGGLFPLSVSDSEFDNLFYCGGSVQPGAGLPMVTLSGQFAADRASRRLMRG